LSVVAAVSTLAVEEVGEDSEPAWSVAPRHWRAFALDARTNDFVSLSTAIPQMWSNETWIQPCRRFKWLLGIVVALSAFDGRSPAMVDCRIGCFSQVPPTSRRSKHGAEVRPILEARAPFCVRRELRWFPHDRLSRLEARLEDGQDPLVVKAMGKDLISS
jgi:hypothetical protein